MGAISVARPPPPLPPLFPASAAASEACSRSVASAREAWRSLDVPKVWLDEWCRPGLGPVPVPMPPMPMPGPMLDTTSRGVGAADTLRVPRGLWGLCGAPVPPTATTPSLADTA